MLEEEWYGVRFTAIYRTVESEVKGKRIRTDVPFCSVLSCPKIPPPLMLAARS